VSASNPAEDHSVEIMVPCEPGEFLEPRDITYGEPVTLPDGSVLDLNAPSPLGDAHTFYEDEGALLRRETKTQRVHVLHSDGKWRPWSVSPFTSTEITRAEAQQLAGAGVDLGAAGDPPTAR
jgi:hypothetical protein